MTCNICEGQAVDHIFSLPDYPLNSIYLTKDELGSKDKFRPREFSLYLCDICGHFQALSGVNINELYNDEYRYNTQNSGVQGRISFFLSQLDKIKKTKFNRIIDVGCFDLSLLKVVKQKIDANYFIGVDPSIPPECLTNDENIICFKDYVDNVDLPYFDNDLPDLIISDQTFEHIPTINSTLRNIVQKVSFNSVFAICVPSMEVLIEKLNFHNLIHEHVNYFSINTLTELFERNGTTLESYTLNYTATCGFLFGIFIKGNGAQQKKSLNNRIISKEFFLNQYNTFRELLTQTECIISSLNKEKIYGFGASDITANLAYFLNSDFSFMKNIIDDTIYKQGKFYPFLLPEVIASKGIENLSDANCFITAPQAARYIYPRLNSFNFKKIINPIGLMS